MAKLPTLKRILRADLGLGVPAWIDQVLLTINNFMQNAWAQLNNGLTFEDNFAARIMVVEVHGEAPSAQFASPFDRPVKGIMILAVNGTELLLSAPGVVWQQVGQVVHLTQIFGLAATGRFSLTLLVI